MAQVLATSIILIAQDKQKSIAIEPSAQLQNFANLLHDLQKRDIVVVNRQKLILADRCP
ncbi:MAG: hypothetical protein HC772_16175 [Leptolyngbyaceae cyanobacterium CRU_2_3]|nr:hypothetical protein [Leptolyngbyaceae cyanobacterium CRU_2_3]